MAQRKTDNIITGNDPHQGVCLYYSPHFEMNIMRKASSLTGKRTKTDPAFKGFRQSSSRLKQASPIASALYKQVPEKMKQYALYRILTGEAIKMLKEGIEATAISETLKIKYIDPLLNTRPTRISRMTRKHRSFLFQNITAATLAIKYFSSTETDPLQRRKNISDSHHHEPEPLRRRIKTTHNLIYLGRLPECKKLKMWLRPIDA